MKQPGGATPIAFDATAACLLSVRAREFEPRVAGERRPFKQTVRR